MNKSGSFIGYCSIYLNSVSAELSKYLNYRERTSSCLIIMIHCYCFEYFIIQCDKLNVFLTHISLFKRVIVFLMNFNITFNVHAFQ